jgi:hypothetical protein
MESSRAVRGATGAPASRGLIPLWLKIVCTVFACLTFSVYWAYYSFAHTFLWHSSLALLMTCVALWLENALLASMQAVSVVFLELSYTVDFFFRLLTGQFLTGLSVYIFQAEDAPLWVRAFSLFHIPLPFLLLWMLCQLGYDRRAGLIQSGVTWILLPVCYFFTDPADNVNWVFGPRGETWDWVPSWSWLVLLMIAFPLFLYLPSHWLFRRLFRDAARPQPPQ